MEKTINARYKIRIPYNTIHKVMLELGFAKHEKSKQKRRKPWIRYERKHSLSAVHMDWHESKVNGKQLCTVLDDASRKVLAAGEFDNPGQLDKLVLKNKFETIDFAYYQLSFSLLIRYFLTFHYLWIKRWKRDSLSQKYLVGWVRAIY